MRDLREFIVKLIKGMIVGVAAMSAGAGTFAILLGIYGLVALPLVNKQIKPKNS